MFGKINVKSALVALFLLMALCGCTQNYVEWSDSSTEDMKSEIDWDGTTRGADVCVKNLARISSEYHEELAIQISKLGIPIVWGAINSDFERQLMSALETSNRIAIYSDGGDVEIALRLANAIATKNNIEILVFGICQSSCAEFILPAAQTVKLIDQPLIGFHGNPLSMLDILNREPSNPCQDQIDLADVHQDLKSLSDEMIELYKNTNHNPDFWKIQKQNLGHSKLSQIRGSDGQCSIGQKSHVEYWYPTTEIMNRELGLTTKGKVCADDIECRTTKPLFYSDDESVIRVGEDKFLTEMICLVHVP